MNNNNRQVKINALDGIFNQPNYITNSRALYNNTEGWNTYADAAGTAPVDGTGGVPGVTISTGASLQEGSYNFSLVKGASNLQGNGWSTDFTIDNCDKAKVLQIQFEYSLSTGTFVAGTDSTSSDVTVWIIDKTNGTVIQPTTFKLYSNSGTISTTFVSNFQTASNSTEYRLCLHVGSTSTSAYTLNVDKVQVFPSQYVYGTPISDWQSYTPTVTSMSGSVTNSTNVGKWRRVGDSMEIEASSNFTAASAAFSRPIYSLPSGYTVDTSKFTYTGGNLSDQIVGYGRCSDSATNAFPTSVAMNTTTTFFPFAFNASTAVAGFSEITNLSPFTFTAADGITSILRVPIVGWSASVQQSDQADSRAVAARFKTSTARTINNTGPTLVYETVDYDTHGAYNATTGNYTALVSGYYKVSGYFFEAPIAHGVNNQTSLVAAVDGTNIASICGSRAETTAIFSNESGGSTTVYMRAGQVLTIRGYADTANTLGASTPTLNWVCIERLAQASLMSATETVACRYTSAVTQSISNADVANTVLFGTKDYDTHGAYNATTGLYTAPVSGKYRVTTNIPFGSAAWTAGNRTFMFLYKNGVATNNNLDLYWVFSSVTLELFTKGTTTISLNAGDTVHINIIQNSSGAKALSALGRELCIERIGI